MAEPPSRGEPTPGSPQVLGAEVLLDVVVEEKALVVVPRARFQVYVSPSRCFWRLLGRNNRAYARSADSSGSAEEMRDLALLAARSAAEGNVDLMSARGREWEWALTVDGVTVARSNGAYGRRVECLASVERFRLVAPGAPVTFVRFTNRDAARHTTPTPLARVRPGSSSHNG